MPKQGLTGLCHSQLLLGRPGKQRTNTFGATVPADSVMVTISPYTPWSGLKEQFHGILEKTFRFGFAERTLLLLCFDSTWFLPLAFSGSNTELLHTIVCSHCFAHEHRMPEGCLSQHMAKNKNLVLFNDTISSYEVLFCMETILHMFWQLFLLRHKMVSDPLWSCQLSVDRIDSLAWWPSSLSLSEVIVEAGRSSQHV